MVTVATDLLGADAAEAAGRLGGRRRRRARRSASACRSGTAGPTPPSWRSRPGSSATCPAGSSGCRSTPRTTPPTAWRCRHVSSTSAARRPRRTSARRRCCWPSWPPCTRCTTGRRACAGIARRVHGRTVETGHGAAAGAASTLEHEEFFDTVVVRAPGRAAAIVEAARGQRRAAAPRRRRPRRHLVRRDDHAGPRGGGAREPSVRKAAGERPPTSALPEALVRRGPILSHPVFSEHHSETAMLRYLRQLSDRDFALDRGMIPLGSCTMKLNATTEMEPVGLPGFRRHPPVRPAGQHAGLPVADRRPRAVAGRADGLRQGLGPAQRREPGRAGRPAGHPGLPPVTGRRRARRVPDPVERPRDERRVRRDGRHARRGGVGARATAPSTWRTCGPSARSTATAWPPSWSRTRRRTASTRRASATCAPWSTSTAARSTSTGPTSTPCWDWRSRGSSAATSRTSTSTRPSASPTAAAARASGPVAVAEHLVPFLPSHPMHPRPEQREGIGPVERGAVRQCGDPGDQLGLRAAALRRRPGPCHQVGGARRQLRGRPAGPVVPDPLHRQERPRRARVHRGPADPDQGHGGHRRRRGEAADRLRLPRAHGELPRGRHAHGGADRERGPGRAGPVLRGDDRHPGRDRRRGGRALGGRGQPAARCAAHGGRAGRGVGAALRPPGAVFPTGYVATKYWPPVARINQAYGDRHLVCTCPPPEAFAS